MALARAVLATWEPRGLASYGIYSCRASSGGAPWSVHAEGRAWDARVPTDAASLGHQLLIVLADRADELGLQRVIWWRRQYDAGAPGGRPYTGPNPHYDHLHIEQDPAAAQTLTYAQAVAVLRGREEDDAPMVVVMFSDVPGDTAAWLLVGSRRLYLHHWTNVEALQKAGAATLRLPREVVERMEQV